MSLWQNLLAGYNENSLALSKLFPLSSTSVSNKGGFLIVVILNAQGAYQRCRLIPSALNQSSRKDGVPVQNIIIPVSEASMGRSSGICAHPLFDTYDYVYGNAKKHSDYCQRLKRFADACKDEYPKLIAVYNYVVKQGLAEDLSSSLGLPDKIEPKPKTIILFSVEEQGDVLSNLWEDPKLFEVWHRYYLEERRKLSEQSIAEMATLNKLKAEQLSLKAKIKEKPLKKEKEAIERYNACLPILKNKQIELKDLIAKQQQLVRDLEKEAPVCDVDFISGEHVLQAKSHPKKLVNSSANAKLISDNDNENYTYRGRFLTSNEAFSLGYEASQKAHQFLRYVVKDRGIACGTQTIVSFTASNLSLPAIPIDDRCLSGDGDWDDIDDDEGMSASPDGKVSLAVDTGRDFCKELELAINGVKEPNDKGHMPAVVLVLDAATTGRLSVIFYRELSRLDFFEKMRNWHQDCRWKLAYFDKGKECRYTGAPTIDRIIEAVFGRQRGKIDESFGKIKKQAREVLMRAIFDNMPFPEDYARLAAQRCSRPLLINQNEHFDRRRFNSLLAVTCSILNKHYKEKGKDSFDMSIDVNRKDRDYLYGRLLGAADLLEEDALRQKSNDRLTTTAIRYMQAFSQRPFTTWRTIHDLLIPYIQVVKNRLAFKELEQIVDLVASTDFENDTPLGGAYLIGYYHERMHIRTLVKELSGKNKQEPLA